MYAHKYKVFNVWCVYIPMRVDLRIYFSTFRDCCTANHRPPPPEGRGEELSHWSKAQPQTSKDRHPANNIPLPLEGRGEEPSHWLKTQPQTDFWAASQPLQSLTVSNFEPKKLTISFNYLTLIWERSKGCRRRVQHTEDGAFQKKNYQDFFLLQHLYLISADQNLKKSGSKSVWMQIYMSLGTTIWTPL